MQFSDTTNKSGILQECESWIFGNDYGAITDNPQVLATFTRNANNAVNEIITEILEVDERWQFDDSNHVDYPIGITDLVDGQQDYVFDVSQIKITAVEVMGVDGKYKPLKPIDITDIEKYGKGTSPKEYKPENGTPLEYDVTATSLFLYPAPATGSVTMTAGLKVYFQRAGVAFVTSDTTAVPGFPSLFHQIVAIKASNRYAKQNSMTGKARELDVIETKLMEGLRSSYSNRHLENASTITPFIESNR